MPYGLYLRLAHRQGFVGAGESAARIARAVGLHVADVQHEGEIGPVHVPDERRHPGFIGRGIRQIADDAYLKFPPRLLRAGAGRGEKRQAKQPAGAMELRDLQESSLELSMIRETMPYSTASAAFIQKSRSMSASTFS